MDAATGKTRVVDTLHDEAWIREAGGGFGSSSVAFLPDNKRIAFLSERDGWDGSVGELAGYLAVSALLGPGGLVLAVEERSRYGTLVLAVACLVVAVVELRLLSVWSAGE